MNGNLKLSDRAKHRLRLAAGFMRKAGYSFEEGNFYMAVLSGIRGMGTKEQETLRGQVDWVEAYEKKEIELYGEPSRSRARRSKSKSGRDALRTGRLPAQD